jgi:hypothetical protein
MWLLEIPWEIHSMEAMAAMTHDFFVKRPVLW